MGIELPLGWRQVSVKVQLAPGATDGPLIDLVYQVEVALFPLSVTEPLRLGPVNVRVPETAFEGAFPMLRTSQVMVTVPLSGLAVALT